MTSSSTPFLPPARLRRRRALLADLLALGTIGSLPVAAGARTAAPQHDHAAHLAGEAARAALLRDEFAQPLLELAQRVHDALARGGEPLPQAAWAAVRAQADAGDLAAAAGAALHLLQERVLLTANITAEARISVKRTQTRTTLVQGGWRLFLVRVNNPALVPGRFAVTSPNAVPVYGLLPPDKAPPSIDAQVAVPTTRGDLAKRWLDLDVHDEAPLDAVLNAVPVDFKLLRLYARDAGYRSATLALDIGVGTGDIGGRDRVSVDFRILPARSVQLSIRDHDGAPVTASLLVTDRLGRVLPSQTRRSPPDMFFQKKVYRADGQTLLLPPGDYRVEHGRGPEYLAQASMRRVPDSGNARWTIKLARWIDPAAMGWYSGDHHIHAAGCAHYQQPEQGVAPEMIMPQVRGEGLSVGSVLAWAPGYEEQKKYFTAADAPQSDRASILHYDLEVSGFPSSHGGHLALLQMRSIAYPGAASIGAWPSTNAPVLRWAKAQGAVTGYAHAGSGLWAGSTTLPNELMPPFDGIGANDFIVTLPEGLVDFIGVCNHPPASEMNIWYHTLNTGLRSRIAGETDWPCFFEESVGMGRSYVRLDGELSYSGWCQGLRQGRSYVSEGRAHLIDFQVAHGSAVAVVGGTDLTLDHAAPLQVSARVAARLEAAPDAQLQAIAASAPMDKPYWHLERARLGASRRVRVELVANGVAVAAAEIEADGTLTTLRFDYVPTASCWLALRIDKAAHTNPVWIGIGGRPLAVRNSALWCRAAVDRCWLQKMPRMRAAEVAEEQALYDRARRYYERVAAAAG